VMDTPMASPGLAAVSGSGDEHMASKVAELGDVRFEASDKICAAVKIRHARCVFRRAPEKRTMKRSMTWRREAYAQVLKHCGNRQDELIGALSQACREELVAWANTPKPAVSVEGGVLADLFQMTCWMARSVGLGRVWGTGPGFYREWARLGGESRIKLLLTIAKFDMDHSGTISKTELDDYKVFGERLVNDAMATMATFAIVFALLISATHSNVIGRPSPWSAPAEIVDLYGAHAAEGLLVATYILNVATEVLCILALCSCLMYNTLLRSVLTTLDSKICFLLRTNVLATLTSLIAYVVTLLVLVMAMGGVLSYPKWGFLAVGAIPAVLVVGLPRLCARWFLEVTLGLHDEACTLYQDARKDMNV